jgi:hypothetical protein
MIFSAPPGPDLTPSGARKPADPAAAIIGNIEP